MSCFIVNTYNLNTAIHCAYCLRQVYYTASALEELDQAFNLFYNKDLGACSVAEFNELSSKALMNLNYKAYKTRYNREPEPVDTPLFDENIRNNFYKSLRYEKNKWFFDEKILYQALKTLECYIYQCSESQEIEESPIYKAIEKIIQKIKDFIINDNPAYVAAVWG